MKNPYLVVLFGSRARGTASPRSDADIAVLADHSLGLGEKTEIAEEMAREFGISEDSIDIVDLWNASPLLQYQVAEQGKLIRGTAHDFVRFRVLAWKRYLDTAKFRRIRAERLKQFSYAK